MLIIKSIPLSEITKIAPEITDVFIESLVHSFPDYIKINPTHYIVNTNLTISSQHFIPVLQKFALLLQTSRAHCHLLQLTKN